MKTLQPTIRFVMTFLSAGFLLCIVFVALFLRAASADQFLRVFLSRWEHDPESAFLWLQLLAGPLFCLAAGFWWYFKTPSSGYPKPAWLSARVVIVFVAIVFLANLVFLEFFRRSINEQFRDSGYYHFYVVARSVVLSPSFLIADLLFVGFVLWLTFGPGRPQANETERLGALALTLANVCGLLLSALVAL